MIRKPLLVAVCALLVLTLTSCSGRQELDERAIYIPILADAAWLTADGQFLNGVQLAVEDVNREYADQGYKISTAVLDDGALYERGVEIATQLAADGNVTAVLNLQNFDVSKTTADILSRSGKLTLFPYGAYDSLFAKDLPNLFSGVPAFSDLGQAMADWAVRQGYRRIAVYHNGVQSQEELVTAFELRLRNTGTKVVDYVPSIASGNEFDKIYRRWQALGADCVVIAQYGLDRAFEVLNLLRSRDPGMAVIGEPIFNRANALAANLAAAEGMTVPSTLALQDGPDLTAFRERYQLKYATEADVWAVQGYDMLRLVVDTAVRLQTNSPDKIAAALHEAAGYRGIGRQIAFKRGGALVTDTSQIPALICRSGVFRQE